MNWKRILLGGLAAGALIDVFEGGISGLFFGQQFRAEMAHLGLPLQVGPAGGLFWLVNGVLPHVRDAVLGILSPRLSFEFILFQLVWQLAATLLGAFIYREPPGRGP